ncbi:hypothetical protein DC915_RS03245 [Vibrio parahaemolyticus]|nr:hypothetical protein [Vibrio parahaemolyticus]EJG0009995.1 hypothetical protein [Vibrio parahaemolyticus]
MLNTITLNQNHDQNVQPKRGDIIVPLCGPYIGRKGLIERLYLQDNGSYDIQFGFNLRAHKQPGDFSRISCSGGPCDGTNTNALTFVGTAQQTFWCYKDGYVDAGNGVEYSETVNVWCYKPEFVKQRTSLGHEFDSFNELLEHHNFITQQSQKLTDEINSIHSKLSSVEFYRVYRGEHLKKAKEGQWDNGFHQDVIGRAIFDAYSHNLKLMISEHDKPVGCGYLYTTGDGWALRNKSEFDLVLNAYNLKVDEERGPWGQILLIPNIDVDTWKPLSVELITTKEIAK